VAVVHHLVRGPGAEQPDGAGDIGQLVGEHVLAEQGLGDARPGEVRDLVDLRRGPARALADQDGLAARVADLIGERQRLASALRALRFEIVPSAANFLLVRPPSPAPAVAAWLQGGGFIVRSYAGHPRLDDWLRLAVRSPDEDDRLLRRLAEFR
jgi:hypothetical protein